MTMVVDMQDMPFEHFVELIEPMWLSSCTVSYVEPHYSHTIILNPVLQLEIPEEFHKQIFDNDYLQPIASNLGIGLNKLAELLALRNAWIAYIQEAEISKYSFDEIKAKLTNEIAASYLLLTSKKWFEHPWIQEQINQSDIQEVNANSPHPLDDPDRQAHYQAWMEDQLNDINYCINMFESEKNRFKSFFEVDADSAMQDIKRAKKRIAELHSEIEDQESIINQAMPKIREIKRVGKTTINEPGHPKRTKEQQERSDIAKKFVGKWVNSLMDVLSIDSCSELAREVGGQKITKMTWWRWKNNETLPPLRLLYTLLNSKVKSDGQKTVKLCDVQTTPSLRNLISLIELI